ncbi:uncharacterized protein M6B38_263775 [Iris pallida]|uniref:Uncharacterized protein n=1 Tax=Iris pallida TaxID=29817 RepID=A0AAX6ICF3_IRIPA|nr:uncharacterized protein M6B38_263775 [Iris pallida]
MLRPDLLPILVLFVYYQFWMFRMYEKYILWLDIFVVGQVLDVCGWTCVGCVGSLWCMNNMQFNNINFRVYSY